MSCLRDIKVSLETKEDQSPEHGPKQLQKTDNKRVSCKVCLSIHIEKIQKYFEKCEILPMKTAVRQNNVPEQSCYTFHLSGENYTMTEEDYCLHFLFFQTSCFTAFHFVFCSLYITNHKRLRLKNHATFFHISFHKILCKI